jgi:hypothetical protein
MADNPFMLIAGRGQQTGGRKREWLDRQPVKIGGGKEAAIRGFF